MIEVEHVTAHYGAVRALHDVSLRVEAGEVLLLLGANGAGKSTLLRCILGITGFHGRIRVAGRDPLTDGKRVRASIGYMPQDSGLHQDLTVAETIRFYTRLRGVDADRGETLLGEMVLDDATASTVGDLSGGMRQRLGFALALLSDPQILLLDEPTASLDGWSRDYLTTRVDELARSGKTILLSTHAQHDLSRVARRAVALSEGSVRHEAHNGDRAFARIVGDTASARRGAMASIVEGETR